MILSDACSDGDFLICGSEAYLWVGFMIIYCCDAGVLSVIHQWGSVYFRIPRAEIFISGDPFISGFPGPIQMVENVCSEIVR